MHLHSPPPHAGTRWLPADTRGHRGEGASPLTWMMSHAAAQIRLPAPHPSSSHLSSCRRGENALPSVQLQSLTHYFYFSCRQAIAKIPTHQHIHRCKLSCPQPPEKKSLTPSYLQCAILQKDSKEEKGTASERGLGHQLTWHPGKKRELGASGNGGMGLVPEGTHIHR